ncbi:hypothetical protein Syun_009607 [Stephania yunnanensis]|uniref:Uncharacterized protein n=1 Tax=Stephania yunnanensis TaxID=152371 RepID=A0AAP0PNQ3_9MAGN
MPQMLPLLLPPLPPPEIPPPLLGPLFCLNTTGRIPPRTTAAAAAERRRSLLWCPRQALLRLRRASHSPTLSCASLAAPPSSSLLYLSLRIAPPSPP